MPRALLLLAALAIWPSGPVAAWQCPDGAPPPCAGHATSANSVGVLLFTNVTRDSADAYLAEGLSSEIATSLARIPRLEVRSPGAVLSAQRGGVRDPATVGRRLNVRYVVEGDYQRGGGRIRIAVRLVSVADGTQRWSNAWTVPAADLLAVQEEIGGAVATAIAGRLLPQERTVLAVRTTHNAAAYDHYLRGNYLLGRRTPASVQSAIDEYRTALRLDPGFAAAQARVALSYALFLDWGWDLPGVPRDSQLALGGRAADSALSHDSLLADGWMARGYLLSMRHPRDFTGALEALARATALDGRNAEAWHQYGSALGAVGRFADGDSALSRALALEPGRAISWGQMGNNLEAERREAAALAAYDSSIADDPAFYAAYAYRAFLRLRRGDVAGAASDAEQAQRSSPRGETYYGLSPRAAVTAARGDSAAARALMRDAGAGLADREPGPQLTVMLAMGMLATGQADSALSWLERTEPAGAVLWSLLQLPAFDPLRGRPRFHQLEARSRAPESR